MLSRYRCAGTEQGRDTLSGIPAIMEHKRIDAAILSSIPQFCFQKVAGNSVKTQQGMITVCLVMAIEGFTLLSAVGIEQG